MFDFVSLESECPMNSPVWGSLQAAYAELPTLEDVPKMPGNPSRGNKMWEILQFESSMMRLRVMIVSNYKSCPSQPFPSLFARLHSSRLKTHGKPVLRVPHDKGSWEKRCQRWISAGWISRVCVCVDFLVGCHEFKRCWPTKRGHSPIQEICFSLYIVETTYYLYFDTVGIMFQATYFFASGFNTSRCT